MFETLGSFAGRIGATFVNGTFVVMSPTDIAFCKGVMRSGDTGRTWVPQPLPVYFRTQLDVRTTSEALGARNIGGTVSAIVVGDNHARSFKANAQDGFDGYTLEDIANGEVPQQPGLTIEQYNMVINYYNS